MEHFEHNDQPREVVLEYRQPDSREVVEKYSCPLPKPRRLRREIQPENRKRRGKRRGLWIFLGFAAAAVVILGVMLALYIWNGWGTMLPWDGPFANDRDYDWEESEEITIPAWQAEEGVVLEVRGDHGSALTAQEIYRQVNPAVVTVFVEVGTGFSVGTGVFFTEDGYLLTNYHVVEGGRQCQVILESGYSYEAWFVAGDAAQDLAILKIDQTGLPTAEFGDSDLLTVGDPVYAIGNPLGYELRGTLTDGIVSAIDRDVQVNGDIMTLIQTNAALNEGNSGGPLINQYGQVVGINVIKMDSNYSTIEGLGFAIPSSVMRRMVNDLLLYGELQPEPLLGITVMTVGEQLTDTLWGTKVDSVTPDSAADRAGIQAGDFIISIGEMEKVLGSGDVLRVRRQYHLGEQMPITLWRDGEILEVTLDLQVAAE